MIWYQEIVEFDEDEDAQETNRPQQTSDVPKVMYKFYIYGLDTSRQYKIIDVTPQNTEVEDMFVVNNPTDNINATNTEAIQKATELYEELKNNPESLNLYEIHYMKVNNETDHKLVKIIR